MSAAIADGLTDTSACALCGIDASTYYRWMREGKKDSDGLLYHFYQAIKKANAERERSWVKHISDDPSWQSKAWLLERRFHDEWGKKKDLEEKNQSNLEVVFHSIQQMSPSEWQNKIEK